MARDERRHYPRRDRRRQLRAFRHAARLRSIGRAAEHRFASQPAVSQQVRTLEDELAASRFERNDPRIALTPAGARLDQLASPLVEGLDRLPGTFIEQRHEVASGVLDVAAGQTTSAMVLPDYLRASRHRHPDILVNVRSADRRERLRWLRACEVDVAVAVVDLPPPDLDFRPVFSSETVFINPEDHPVGGRETVEIVEIAAFAAVTHSAAHDASEVTDTVLRQHGQVADTVLEGGGWNVILERDRGIGRGRGRRFRHPGSLPSRTRSGPEHPRLAILRAAALRCAHPARRYPLPGGGLVLPGDRFGAVRELPERRGRAARRGQRSVVGAEPSSAPSATSPKALRNALPRERARAPSAAPARRAASHATTTSDNRDRTRPGPAGYGAT